MNGYFYCIICDCKRFFNKGLCEVCNKPYKKYKSDIDITDIGEHILECGVFFNPEFILCRGSVISEPCKYARDCFEYHSLNFDDYKKFDDKK